MKIFIFLKMTSRAATTLPLHKFQETYSHLDIDSIYVYLPDVWDEIVDITGVSRKTFDVLKEEPEELLCEEDELYF